MINECALPLLVKQKRANIKKIRYGTITKMLVAKGLNRENQGDSWDLQATRLGDHFMRRS
ncbi:MAG: hypothetical protein B1H12_09940 [Desulfobacteraceae bacterium 4484_190.2]|nr:MAG: hypothetical protein B1H12_09940 [Desulfobacteraceae bacterium 4484_190.2]